MKIPILVLFIILVLVSGYTFWLESKLPQPLPIYKTYWYVDRGWREDWKCKTKEEAREMAGSGRIYKKEELFGYMKD